MQRWLALSDTHCITDVRIVALLEGGSSRKVQGGRPRPAVHHLTRCRPGVWQKTLFLASSVGVVFVVVINIVGYGVAVVVAVVVVALLLVDLANAVNAKMFLLLKTLRSQH